MLTFLAYFFLTAFCAFTVENESPAAAEAEGPPADVQKVSSDDGARTEEGGPPRADDAIRIYCLPQPKDPQFYAHVMVAVWGDVYHATPNGLSVSNEQRLAEYLRNNWKQALFAVSLLDKYRAPHKFSEFGSIFLTEFYDEFGQTYNCVDFAFALVNVLTDGAGEKRQNWPKCFRDIEAQRSALTGVDLFMAKKKKKLSWSLFRRGKGKPKF